ncbi:Uncharacterised protein [Mycobacteroides abscessus subsp. abscessus]|nr:Uncharacterised protein [Mycobacteroides abscessus subsp. abscessus]
MFGDRGGEPGRESRTEQPEIGFEPRLIDRPGAGRRRVGELFGDGVRYRGVRGDRRRIELQRVHRSPFTETKLIAAASRPTILACRAVE